MSFLISATLSLHFAGIAVVNYHVSIRDPLMKNSIIVFFLLLLFACKKEAEQVQTTNPYQLNKPVHFPAIAYNNPENEITQQKYILGKRLFFDPILSIDSSISCASCHAPEHAFADHNLALSKGINGKVGTRHSPALFNLAWMRSFNWDGGVNHLEVFPIAPITNELEMGEDLKNVLRKLNQSQSYQVGFKAAFGSDKIEDKQMMLALTQYMLMIVSDDAKYDQVKRGTAAFTAQEQEGYLVYQNHCSSCHVEPLFTSPEYKSNGFNKDAKELGRMRITQLEKDRNLFKVPSLRNLKFTYPYMHNGKLWNLDAVIAHYQLPKPDALNAEPSIVNGMKLTETEVNALKAFLNTLNDNTFIANPFYR